MFCPKCGTEMPDGAAFCIKCGAKLPAESTVQQPNAVQMDAPTKAQKKKSKLPIILGAAVLLIVIAVVVYLSNSNDIDYIATAKAHTPFAVSQNLPYTFNEVFGKYITNPIWYTDSKDEKTDTAIVKVDGVVKGTGDNLIVSIKVSPNPDDPNGCLIQPQSVKFGEEESVDMGSAVDFLYILFAAYDEGAEDLSELQSHRGEISAMLSGSGFSELQGNIELTETYANTDMGISFRYPSDWILDDETLDDFVTITMLDFNYASGSGSAAVFGVYDLTEAYENGIYEIDVFTEDVATLEKSYNQQANTTVLSIEDVTISGVPARVLKYQSGGLNGTDPTAVRDYYINKGRVYRITCSCNKSMADAFDRIFDAILDSFTITEQESVGSSWQQDDPYWGPNADKLSEFYIGDLSACNMSSEQAEAFASLIENELWQYPVVMAALFDGGNGIPLLWIAHGSDGEWDGNWEYGFTYRIENNYNDQIYAYNNGLTEKCSWMTKLLKTGTDGIIVQIDLDPVYEFGTYFRMYRLNGGTIEPYSFATGAHNPFGECILNSITVAEAGELSELDLFRLVDMGAEYLLSAETGFSGMLILSGNWVDGATMQSALYDYAAAFR